MKTLAAVAWNFVAWTLFVLIAQAMHPVMTWWSFLTFLVLIMHALSATLFLLDSWGE